MKYAGMVTLYNPTKENIEIIDKYIKGLDKLYLIDNSDEDNSHLIPENRKIKYIPNMENLGIATALNIAAKEAIKDGYKWLLTLDQDSNMTYAILKKLENYVNNLKNEKVGIVSPYHDLKLIEKNCNGNVEEMPEVMTSGNLLNLEVFEKVGGFKDWLFIDVVDIEYCFNIRNNGYKVIRLNNVIMSHNLGNIEVHDFKVRKFVCSNHNAIRRYYMMRNTLYVSNMYKKIFPGYCRYLKKVQRGQIKYIILFEKDKLNKLKLMYKGYKDYKKGIKGRLKNYD